MLENSGNATVVCVKTESFKLPRNYLPETTTDKSDSNLDVHDLT